MNPLHQGGSRTLNTADLMGGLGSVTTPTCLAKGSPNPIKNFTAKGALLQQAKLSKSMRTRPKGSAITAGQNNMALGSTQIT